MAQFEITLDDNGLTYSVSHPWYSRLRQQNGFAPLEHISAIEAVTRRVLPGWLAILGILIALASVLLDTRLSSTTQWVGLGIGVGLVLAHFFWMVTGVTIAVDGEEFIFFESTAYHAGQLSRQLNEELANRRRGLAGAVTNKN